jgi:hypothetical protein
MTFKTQAIADLSVIFNADEFAETATYKGVDVLVIEAEATGYDTGPPGFITPLYSVYVSDQEVAQPKAGDVVVYRNVRCRVGQFPRSEGGVWLIDLIKDTVQV